MTKIAAIQMISGDDVAANLATAQHLIQQAVEKEAQLIVLPENFAFMSQDENAKLRIKESLGNGPIQEFLSHQAQHFNITLVAGSIPIQSNKNDKVFATTLVFNEQGKCLAHYHKIHLFDVKVEDESYFESRTVSHGSKIIVVDLPFARVGLSICYDIRFPELYRLMQQVDIIAIPAAFTAKTGRAHWEILVRARAVENLCYVIASNQGGTHPGGRETYGHSMIVNPWGEVVASLEKGEGIMVTDFDRNYLEKIRHNFPALKHRHL